MLFRSAINEEFEEYSRQITDLTRSAGENLGNLNSLKQELDRHDEAERLTGVIALSEAEKKRVMDMIAAAETAVEEIARLTPLISEQDKLESQRSSLQRQVAERRALVGQLSRVDDRLLRLREAYKANSAKLKEARERAVLSANISGLEARDAALVREIASLRAGLERDQRLQKEITNGLCPILSQACLNLKPEIGRAHV